MVQSDVTLRPVALPPLAASVIAHDVEFVEELQQSHREIFDLFLGVHRANGSLERAEAFARCKLPLQRHGLTAAEAIAGIDVSPASSVAPRCGDRASILTTIILSELESWPTTDPGWLKRFVQLERAFAAHVGMHQSP